MQGILKEFVMGMLLNQKVGAKEHEKFMVKFLMNQKLKQDDSVTDQSVKQSRTAEHNCCLTPK